MEIEFVMTPIFDSFPFRRRPYFSLLSSLALVVHVRNPPPPFCHYVWCLWTLVAGVVARVVGVMMRRPPLPAPPPRPRGSKLHVHSVPGKLGLSRSKICGVWNAGWNTPRINSALTNAFPTIWNNSRTLFRISE